MTKGEDSPVTILELLSVLNTDLSYTDLFECSQTSSVVAHASENTERRQQQLIHTQAMCADINVGTDRVGGSVLVEADCLASQIFALSVCLPISLSMCLFVCSVVCLFCMLVHKQACVNVVGGSLAELRDEAAEWENHTFCGLYLRMHLLLIIY